MINDASIEAVKQAQWNPHFIRPLYSTYCFSRIPHLLQSLFSGYDAGIQQQFLGPLAGSTTRWSSFS